MSSLLAGYRAFEKGYLCEAGYVSMKNLNTQGRIMATDEREIENLLYLYAERLDLGDIEGMARLFEHGELLGPDGKVQANSAEAIAALYRQFVKLYPDGTPRTHHVTSNVMIVVDGEQARCRAYFTVFQATDELPLQPIIAGRYEDEFRQSAGKWHFHQRKMLPRLTGNMTQHQQFSAN